MALRLETWSARQLAEWTKDARERTLACLRALGPEAPEVPRLPNVNPWAWELGHVAWFQERWVLRHGLGLVPLRADGDGLFDSTTVAHATRWDLALPPLARIADDLERVGEATLAALQGDLMPELARLVALSVFHEDMHGEALAMTRQWLALPQVPSGRPPVEPVPCDDDSAGDVKVEGGAAQVGAEREEPFVFDNEQWSHAVELAPFAVARRATTAGEYRAFVLDGGYSRRALWSDAGWAWRQAESAALPLYWREASGGRFERRHFDRWKDVAPEEPVVHVNAYEAEAWCRWAGRRLPTEAEWEVSASQAGSGPSPRRCPWGLAEATGRANLDGIASDVVPVGAHATGDSALGLRQAWGNVWEWTASTFGPYPGFVPDVYEEYSAPWFGTHRVLRGGCWLTRSRLLRNTLRNFYLPSRRDVFAGFRSCAGDAGSSAGKQRQAR